MTVMHFSIIIPTLYEAKNIRALIKRIANVNFDKNCCFEVIVVDDNSQDGTVEIVNDLALQYTWLKIIVREEKRDLSLSIVEGFKQARYPVLITMDADLSHPPEKIPELLKALSDTNVDYVIGSRYIQHGSIDDKWPIMRKMISKLGGMIANALIFSHTKIEDPLSGFCAIRKSTLMAGSPLKPIGWKISLEVMVKCRCKKILEIPIHFSSRNQGYSKLNFKIGLHFLMHVSRLCWYKLRVNHK